MDGPDMGTAHIRAQTFGRSMLAHLVADGGTATLDNLRDNGGHVGARECPLESEDLVQNTSEGEEIAALIIGLEHGQGGSYMGRMTEQSGATRGRTDGVEHTRSQRCTTRAYRYTTIHTSIIPE